MWYWVNADSPEDFTSANMRIFVDLDPGRVSAVPLEPVLDLALPNHYGFSSPHQPSPPYVCGGYSATVIGPRRYLGSSVVREPAESCVTGRPALVPRVLQGTAGGERWK